MDFDSRGARLTMNELRGECHKYGLSANGLRLALEKRLKEYKDATYKPPSEGLQMNMASGACTILPALRTHHPRSLPPCLVVSFVCASGSSCPNLCACPQMTLCSVLAHLPLPVTAVT